MSAVTPNPDQPGYGRIVRYVPPADLPQSAAVICLTQKANGARIPSRKLRLACRSSFSTHPGRMRFRFVHSLVFITELAKNKQADRRGQIALFARTVDL